jgi:hypothetical protein
MIEKMRHLAMCGKYTKKQMLVFSYSKLTVQHAKICCSQYQDSMYFYEQKGHIKTIDSFCKYLLDKMNRTDNSFVSLLSTMALDLIE